ncbi:MAG: oligopeptide ABC transporter substrate-binding protein OppA, partial [Gammaproteobacteria bacterium]|nr:oligopeptide ABC transporter substrate-binding protein OppA [Gammaproteobacteria bacterium]
MPEHRARALAVALLCAGLLGCGGQQAGQPAAGPVGGVSGTERAALQVLRKGNGAEPESLDPHRAESVTAANILRDLFEGLVLPAEDGSLLPGAAERWE